ncbi:MAG: hypothetical protein LBD02_07915 [Christensenellaceae bacterium]|jgi:hypothetical protein|nr:hypothetical protein [Christensenellaceae bacterium]
MVPTETRLERVRAREAALFGQRLLPGGDLHENHLRFLAQVADYDGGEPPAVCRRRDEQSIARLRCPVLRVDGGKPIAESAAWIMGQLQGVFD